MAFTQITVSFGIEEVINMLRSQAVCHLQAKGIKGVTEAQLNVEVKKGEEDFNEDQVTEIVFTLK